MHTRYRIVIEMDSAEIRKSIDALAQTLMAVANTSGKGVVIYLATDKIETSDFHETIINHR